MNNIELSNRTTEGFTLPQDNWYHIVSLGEAPHKPTGTVQVIDQKAVDAMINRFREEAKNANFALRIDYDHFSYDPNQSSAAAGWIENLQSRENGLWANIRWSKAGGESVQGGEYRFVSPVWLPSDVEELGSNRIRPLRIDSVALTNNPNLNGLEPLSNRDKPNKEDQKKEKNMSRINQMLGLSSDASEGSQVEALQAMLNRRDELETANGTLETQVQALTASNDELKSAQVESDLEKYANRFTGDESKEKWRKALMANRQEAIDLLETVPIANGAPPVKKGPVLNRRDTIEPKPSSKPLERTSQIKAAVQPYMNAANGDFNVAFNMAAEANPELFAFEAPAATA